MLLNTNSSIFNLKYKSRRINKHLLLRVIPILFISSSALVLATLINNYNQETAGTSAESSTAIIRGQAGDLWADIVLGKRDFTEISAREIVQYKVNSPGGVIVDRSVSPGRMYVWDSANSRVLGIDLNRCYSQTSPCNADIVIGQPSGNDWGACNRDSSVQNYPDRAQASSSTLCGIKETTQTTLEDKSFTAMFVDQGGNLYIADFNNHRVLKYLSPFTTDTIADEVWGQEDFTGVYCNRTQVFTSPGNPNLNNGQPDPTNSSLCFSSTFSGGAGVVLDSQGNLWVADGGNNRVLRFPAGSRVADLVLGQTGFTSGPKTPGNTLDKFQSPNSLTFDSNGNLYVSDGGNNRVLLFQPPFTTGMRAVSTFGNVGGWNTNVQLDPFNRGIWTYDNIGWEAQPRLWNFDGSLNKDLPKLGNNGGGSLGIDSEKNILASTYVYGQDVYRLSEQLDGSYQITKNIFSPPAGYNLTSLRRLEHPAWAGVSVWGNQVVVTDGRILFWNDKNSLTNGQVPDGNIILPQFWVSYRSKTDNQGKIWIVSGHVDGWDQEIAVYQSPISSNSTPVKTIKYPLKTIDGTEIPYVRNENGIKDIAISDDGNFLWLSETNNNRVLRIKNPLTNPFVDVILGQTDLNGKSCNRGVIPPPNTGTQLVADLNMLCNPGGLSIDKLGNLYVSDHFLEAEGNFRLLMFSRNTFPDVPATVIFAPTATKSFPRSLGFATWEPAFDSGNKMVVGFNPYIGSRFPMFYNNPTAFNPANPSDPEFAREDGKLNDFYSWATSATFDSENNLYMYDANRGQVRIYLNPFGSFTPTPSPNLTPTSVPPTFTPTPLPTFTPTPTPYELLLNSGFETDVNNDGRPDNWSNNNRFTRSTTSVHGGLYSGRHSSTNNATYDISQTVGNIIGSKNYSFTAWTSIPPTSDNFTYKIQLIWKNSSGSIVRTDTVKSYNQQTPGWDQAIYNKLSPSDAKSVIVRMVSSSLKTTVYSDDFHLTAN